MNEHLDRAKVPFDWEQQKPDTEAASILLFVLIVSDWATFHWQIIQRPALSQVFHNRVRR